MFQKAKQINSIIFLFVIMLIIILAYLCVYLHPSPDSNYYLSVARHVLDGYTPTYNVDTGYTPFVYYILAGGLSLLGNTHVTAGIVVSFFHLLNIFLIYYILKILFKTSNKLNLVFLAFYILALFKLSGYSLVLEPFQVFFALVSIIFIANKNNNIYSMIPAGLAMGISIMCKQYSALYALGFFLWLLNDLLLNRSNFKRLFIKGFFFGLAAILPYLLFVIITKATLIGSLTQFGIFGNLITSYVTDKPLLYQSGLKNIIEVIGIYSFELLPFILYPLYKFQNKISKEIAVYADLIFIVGLMSSLSFLIRQYSHYFQLILPFSIILWAIILTLPSIKNNSKINKWITIIAVVIGISNVAYFSPKLAYYKYKDEIKNKSSYYVKLANESLSVFKAGSRLYVRGNSSLYAFCNYRNPLLNYAFVSPQIMFNNGGVPKSIKNVIIPKFPEDEYNKDKKFFLNNGFSVLVDNKYGLYLFR